MSARKSLRVIEGGRAPLDAAVRDMTGQPLAVLTPAAGAADDPIFALIEAHKRAFWKRMEAGAAYFELDNDDPEREVGEAAHYALSDVANAAAIALTNSAPTTMAGVMALIDYVDAFNRGQFRFNDEWFSAPYNWTPGASFDFEDSDEIDDPDGECGMAFAVLLNVRKALAMLALQS
jgi:hypothetical protein